MHLTLSFTPTSLTAALWDGLESVVELSAGFRVLPSSSSSDQPLSTPALLQALDSTIHRLAQHADLGAVTTISGAVPHPTSLSLPNSFIAGSKLARLDPHRALNAQNLPDVPIADLFSRPSSASTDPDPAPLGLFLTSLLLQRAGASTAQERALTSSFCGTEPLCHVVGAAEALGQVGPFWRERFGLARARVLPFLPAALAMRLTLSPRAGDLVVLHTEHIDYAALSTSTDAGLPELVGPGAVAVLADANAPAARKLVRDKYANGKWDVLAHLAAILPPGGGVGHDDKCFAFVRPYPAPPAYPGTTRFEHGAVVQEFRDLRANSRCVLESQVLQLARDVSRLAPLESVSRVLLVSRDLNAAMAPLLAAVFDADVLTSHAEVDLASLGAAIVAIAASRSASNNASSGNGDRPTRPPTPGDRAPSLPSPPRPPSPSSPAGSASVSDAEADPLALRLACAAPHDKFEHEMYAVMVVEYARLGVLVDHGMVAPGRF